MRLALGVLSAVLAATGIAGAQTGDEPHISVGGFALAANGAETPAGVSRTTGRLTIGRPTVSVFSMIGCGYFSVTVPPNSFTENATVGWRVEVTPLKIVDHAVTFRLRWVRALDKGDSLHAPSEDVEVTLRPGESRPIDSVPVVQTGTKTHDGRPCATKAASLRVAADFPDMDSRLIGAQVWLLEREPNGTVITQLQSVRGLPHRPIPFYFDSKPVYVDTKPDSTKHLDIFGHLVADPGTDGIDISLEAIGARAAAGENGYYSARWFRSTLHMKPNEVVEVALTQSDTEEKIGGSGNRLFSIRIQAKRIR